MPLVPSRAAAVGGLAVEAGIVRSGGAGLDVG